VFKIPEAEKVITETLLELLFNQHICKRTLHVQNS